MGSYSKDLPLYQPCPLAELRYKVIFKETVDVTDPVTKKSKPVHSEVCKRWAAIGPIGTTYFYASINNKPNMNQNMYNAEADLTHIAYIHFDPMAHTYDRLEQIQKIRGTTIITTYQVQRTAEFQGMPYFTRLDLKVLSKVVIE